MAVLALVEPATKPQGYTEAKAEAQAIAAARAAQYREAGHEEAARSIVTAGEHIAAEAFMDGGRDVDSLLEEIDAEALDSLRVSLAAEQEAAVVEAGQRSERGRAASFPAETREMLRKRWEREAVACFVGVSTWADFWGGLLGMRS